MQRLRVQWIHSLQHREENEVYEKPRCADDSELHELPEASPAGKRSDAVMQPNTNRQRER